MHTGAMAHLDRPRWWQWPTVLSLDAVAIALAWQALIAGATDAQIGWPHVFVLGTSVWLAYMSDRWIEGRRLHGRPVLTPRHRFVQRRRRAIAVVWIPILAADITVAIACLSLGELAAGLALTAAALAYVVSHQWMHRHAPWRVPKELCIAALLTAGVGLFLRPTADVAQLPWFLAVFGLLCFTNCALISRWEHDVDVVHEQTSLARRSRAATRAIPWLPWTAAAASLMLLTISAGDRGVALCGFLSSVLLGTIDHYEPRLGWPVARVLSDAALLTPLVVLLTAQWR